MLGLEGKITEHVDESQVCFRSEGMLTFHYHPETGFQFSLSPQYFVTSEDVSEGLRIIEKTA